MRWLVVLAIAAMLAGCTDDEAPPEDGTGTDTGTDAGAGTDTGTDTGTQDDNGTTEPEPENETQEPRDPVTWSITISGNRFVDGTITVQQGDTVVWTHEDGTVPHTVTSSGSGPLDSGTMTSVANNEYRYTFTELGEYGYYCEVHPSMTGTITVLEVYLEEP